jgi:hypothetical protein
MYFRAIDEAGPDLPLEAGAGAAPRFQEENCIRINDPVSDKPIAIRLADTNGQRHSAHILLNRRYSWRGYGDHHTIARSPSHTTFTASSDEKMIGTLTLVTDSSQGLAADVLYKDIIDEFRAKPGAAVCELTKFAFESMASSPAILASLFHLIFIYGHREYGCTDLFIEVTPQHARFYEVMLGFKKMGDEKFNESVSVAGQLLWISVADIRKKIDEHGGQNRTSRSLYRYFFSPKEEEGLYARMTATRSSSQDGHGFSRPKTVVDYLLGLAAKKRAKVYLQQRAGVTCRDASAPGAAAADQRFGRMGVCRASSHG